MSRIQNWWDCLTGRAERARRQRLQAEMAELSRKADHIQEQYIQHLVAMRANLESMRATAGNLPDFPEKQRFLAEIEQRLREVDRLQRLDEGPAWPRGHH